MAFRLFFWLVVCPSLMLGFRVIPNFQSWDIDSSSTTSAKLFLDFENGTTEIENDLTGDDPLAGTPTVTIQQVMDSIITDYNNVQGAFVVMASQSDSDFAMRGENRTITVRDGATLGLTSGGHAKPIFAEGRMVGCEIVLAPPFFEKASLLTRGVTHELGHCLGLNHPMDTTNSVMSYYYVDQPVNRLQIDDKMGLVYLYPVNPSAAREEATLGLSCARRAD